MQLVRKKSLMRPKLIFAVKALSGGYSEGCEEI